jgi:radical SAM protein with 4Fe4S-binding SPASM domain
MMEEKTPEQASGFMTKKYRVSKEIAKQDFEKISFNVLTLASQRDVCPFSALGIESVRPFSMDMKTPHRFDLALTYRCNSDCIHCYAGGPRETKELKTDEWKKIIDKIDSLEVGSVVFTGGEPTLRDDLIELVGYNKDLVTGLITNGILLKKKLVSKLERKELDHIQITINGFEKTHNAICNKKTFKKTVVGIKNSLASNIYTITNTTLLKQNISEVPKLMEYLHKLGTTRFAANSIIYTGKSKNENKFALTHEELEKVLKKIRQKAVDLGMEFVWYTPTRRCELDSMKLGLGMKMCSAARINVTVEPDGRVIPCQSWFEGMGNMLEDSWEDIWNSPLAKFARSKGYMPEDCKDCEMLETCTGCPLDNKYCVVG